MDIEIRLDQRRPPSGIIRSNETGTRAFSGWLGMLRELSALLDRDLPEIQDAIRLSGSDTTPRR